MIRIKNRFGFLTVTSIALFSMMMNGCGAFGGHYIIESATVEEGPVEAKFPLNVRLVLNSELCNYSYTSYRQGAKRFYELGNALCVNHRNLFGALFENVTVVSDATEGNASGYDVTVIPNIIDTSALVRPGAPPSFEATVIYECSMVDNHQRTIFLRTIKEDKVYQGYGRNSHKNVMQQAVDEVFVRLKDEMVSSPEIKKFANALK
jgi:hypothetical protein